MLTAFETTIEGMTLWLSANQNLAYLVLFLGSYSETISGPAFFIYGELFFIPGAILGGTGILNIWYVALATISGGILGDYSSYLLGKHFGHRIFKEGNLVFSLENHKKGEDFFAKFGSKAIFFARLLGPLSWITPFLAGTYKVPRRIFFKYNIPGVVVGIGEFLVVGYIFGRNYETILRAVQKDTGYIIGFLALVFVSVWFLKTKRPTFLEKIKLKIKSSFGL